MESKSPQSSASSKSQSTPQSQAQSIMAPSIVERLFASFSDLENSINSAKATLAAKGEIPEHVIERLSSYDTILGKQRRLALELAKHMSNGNWDEVARHVGLINGLSSMIRDDARAILSSLSLNSDNQGSENAENEKFLMC
jgi:hypothetical protein